MPKVSSLSFEKRQRFYLFLIMVLVALGVGAISIYVLYQAAFEERQSSLINIVQSRARIIEAVARFDIHYSSDYPGGALEATLSQFREAHKNFEGFGLTGEFTLAKLESGQIVYLLRHRHSHFPTSTIIPASIPLDSQLAKPMRRALQGQSGTVVSLDYRGQMVLAAYEPVKILDLGLVVKIDLSEIRKPFFNAAMIAGVAGFLVIMLGTIAFFALSDPLMRSLRLTQERLSSIVESAVDGIIVIDQKGITLLMNPSAEAIFGWSSDEIKGKNIKTLMPDPDRANHDQYISAYLKTGQAKILGVGREVTGQRKNGETFPLDLSVSKVNWDNKVAFLGIVRDISKRKEMEKEREKRKLEMEQFAYAVSHDLKSPLITIQGYLSMIKKQVLAGKMDHVENDFLRISKAASQMETMLEDVLEVSRIGRVAGEITEFSLGKVIEEALLVTGGLLLENKITIDVQSDLPLVAADRKRLVQVFQNLISNSVKSMSGRRDPRIQIGVAMTDRGKAAYVRDNGIGIDPKYQNRIFDLFEKLDLKKKGSGVGLSIVKRIIETHDGKVWVSSEGLGKGAAFYFTLPFKQGIEK